MGELFRRNPATAALALIAFALLAVIGFETGWGTSIAPTLPPPGPVVAAAVDAKLLPPLAVADPEQAYPESGARPLFTPTRRPAPQATAAVNMVKGQFTLHGVTIVGDIRIAMLREKGTGKSVRAEKGRDLNGMRVAEIESDRVTLRLGDDSEVIPLLVQRGAAVATSAPAAAAASAGPFPSPSQAAAPGAAPSSARAPAVPGGPVPAPPGTPGIMPARPGIPSPIPGTAAATSSVPLPGTRSEGTPSASAVPGTTPGGPLSPEEVLARRRARRGQQGTQ